MKFSIFISGLASAILVGTMALADPKPKGAKPTSGQVVANYYVGKTQAWKSCKAGIYYGGQWQAQAFCEKKGKSVGVGTWSVSANGKLCHDIIWYWPDGDGYGSKPQDRPDCISHVTDPDGVIWRKWDNDKDWWKLEGSKNLTKGFKFKSKVNRMRKKLGV